ncbi:hypothetical protein [Clostridium magnum]|uniref:Uncharacterized protein n=1 Tax=Clostridium magnum DSM 2767 TaxID=1121326 RepID=A0A162TLX2_9CLOT|nr:hypothetical protein [Clostridium magnum]KZL92811.1 hypothetical protein CLMAG_26250 [Clostridium magnum DSM 2767]SHI28589.1 hypothetical protein SAMN02745944_04019 [Clostridium magnum DSM 2767]
MFFVVCGVVIFGFISNARKGNHSSNNCINDIQVKEEMERQQHQQFVDWSMEKSRKSVTPFESGGYDMHNGNSFNDPHNGGF